MSPISIGRYLSGSDLTTTAREIPGSASNFRTVVYTEG
jgi:hypothetical protein